MADNPPVPPSDAGPNSRTTPEHWRDYFHREFGKESDRACVILAASMLEEVLESLLRSRLVPIAASDDPLFDGANAPISTFSAKIDLAYRIGMVSLDVARNLHLIRKIRNNFAHNVAGCSFEDGAVRNRVLELCRALPILDANPGMRAKLVPGPRGDFELVVSFLLWALWIHAGKVTAFKGPNWGRDDLQSNSSPPAS
jgi:hypothetical protein